MTTDASSAEQMVDTLATHADALLAHFNDEHPDSVAVLARANSDGEAHETALTALTASSVTVTFRPSPTAAPTSVDVAFSAPVTDVDQLWVRALELVSGARVALGVSEPTSYETEIADTNAVPTLLTAVVRQQQLTPHYVLVTVGGRDLQTLATEGFDQFVYVLLPPPGRTELTIDHSFTWGAYAEMPESEQPVGAYYTVRAWRPAIDGSTAEMDLVFAVHDVPEGVAGGHAVRWAQTAEPGDPVALWGPRQGGAPPPDTDWCLLVADETGLPQVAVILEHRPPGVAVHAFVELDGPDDRLPLAGVDADGHGDGVEVHWLYRRGAAAGTTSLLVDAVRSLKLPAGHVFAWGGAESRAVTAIRKYLRHECGIERERVTMVGYWRHRDSPLDELVTD